MFGQLIDLLDKDEILKFSRQNNGERYVKHFDAYHHLVINDLSCDTKVWLTARDY